MRYAAVVMGIVLVGLTQLLGCSVNPVSGENQLAAPH